jgi:hypothetical protein
LDGPERDEDRHLRERGELDPQGREDDPPGRGDDDRELRRRHKLDRIRRDDERELRRRAPDAPGGEDEERDLRKRHDMDRRRRDEARDLRKRRGLDGPGRDDVDPELRKLRELDGVRREDDELDLKRRHELDHRERRKLHGLDEEGRDADERELRRRHDLDRRERREDEREFGRHRDPHLPERLRKPEDPHGRRDDEGEFKRHHEFDPRGRRDDEEGLPGAGRHRHPGIEGRIDRVEERLRREREPGGDPMRAGQLQKELDALKQKLASIGPEQKVVVPKLQPRTQPATPEPVVVPEPPRAGVLNVILVGTLVAVALILGFSVLNRYVLKICKRKTSERIPAALQRQNEI